MKRFTSLMVENPDDLLFGSAPKPVVCGFGLTVGGEGWSIPS
jgi:hypothetical protein